MTHIDSIAPHSSLTNRLRVVWFVVHFFFLLIVVRLFYWQIIRGEALQAQANNQYKRTQTFAGSRGLIFTTDGSLLVGNTVVYKVFAQPHILKNTPQEVAEKITPILAPVASDYPDATDSAKVKEFTEAFQAQLLLKLTKPNTKWIALANKIDDTTRDAIAALNIYGIGFDPYEIRMYPEASMAAHITGFVGKNDEDQQTGYFGIEGALDRELSGRQTKRVVERDALGFHLWGSQNASSAQTGRNVTLTVRRDMQQLVSSMLDAGMEKYGAAQGEIIIMEPSTGKILAWATAPHYDPPRFFEAPAELLKNPSLTSLYEPGSTFKTLTVSAGIDAGVITPDTQCQACDGPRQIGKYSIKTWNGEYHPNITMTDALAKSDNTAMVFVTDLLGKDRFVEYLKKFGLDEKTYVELQEDTAPPFPTKWGPVELATVSFGQGISTTSLNLLKAINAIANNGVMMRPMIVEKVTDPTSGQELVSEPVIERTVVSPETAKTVTDMMVVAAASGEAKWTAAKDYRTAAKTGTSQVAVDGSYDEAKTIASFVGFAPPENPKFIMLVKLVEPSSSIWAAETAAPLWYAVARKLFLLLAIPPDK